MWISGNKYRKSFEKHCLHLLHCAYKNVLDEKILKIDWLENDITYELFEKIENNPIRIKYRIHIAPEFRLPKDIVKVKGFADKLPRVDLKMAHFHSNQEDTYFFEAKRLKETDSVLKRAYIDEGMQRFISKKYPIGCMLGYLLCGTVDRTITGINTLLMNDQKTTEILKKEKHQFAKYYYESYHNEIGIIKHIIFDFTLCA